MPQSNLITNNITLDTLRSPRPGFGRMLILGEHSNFAERFRTVSSLSDLTTTYGFSTSDPEYVAMLAAISQPIRRPALIDIGRATAPVAQVTRFTVTGTADGTYTIPLDGVSFSFAASGSTNNQIRDGLIAAIDASALYAAVSGGAGLIDVTASTPGLPFTVGTLVAPSPATLTSSTTTPNNGRYEDLAAVRAAGSTAYGIHLADGIDSPTQILEAARWCAGDALSVVFAQSDDTNILDAVATSDIAARLKALSRQRALTLFHANNSEHVVAGWLGKQLPTTPETTNWAWQVLNGFTADTLTAAQVTAAESKYANWFERMGAGSTVFTGRMADGNYIDTIRGSDKIKSDLGVDLVDLFQNAGIVPMEPDGVEQVRSTMEASLRRQPIIIASTIQVVAPSFDENDEGRYVLTASDIANRHFTGFTWRAQIRTPANKVTTEGTLSLTAPA